MLIQLPANVPIRSRIAPTPSGYLHLGNVFSFLLTWLIVRKNKGLLHLRIDDLDAMRVREEYIDHIFETLDWLKIDYDSGPQGTEDFFRNYSQKNRLPVYRNCLQQLAKDGWIYACTCSRSQIRTFADNGIYPGTCRGKKLELEAEEVAWRLKLDTEALAIFNDLVLGKIQTDLILHNGDFLVRRKDGIPAYHIASLADDVEEKINLVVRGEDLLPSTGAQLYLAKLLDMKVFSEAAFLHHPLLLNTQQQKLSKSQDAISIKDLQFRSKNPVKVYKIVAFLLNLEVNQINSLEDLLDQFSLGGFCWEKRTLEELLNLFTDG